jgi:hypothetical protein
LVKGLIAPLQLDSRAGAGSPPDLAAPSMRPALLRPRPTPVKAVTLADRRHPVAALDLVATRWDARCVGPVGSWARPAPAAAYPAPTLLSVVARSLPTRGTVRSGLRRSGPAHGALCPGTGSTPPRPGVRSDRAPPPPGPSCGRRRSRRTDPLGGHVPHLWGDVEGLRCRAQGGDLDPGRPRVGSAVHRTVRCDPRPAGRGVASR